MGVFTYYIENVEYQPAMNTGTPKDYEKLVTNHKLRSIREGRLSIYSFSSFILVG